MLETEDIKTKYESLKNAFKAKYDYSSCVQRLFLAINRLKKKASTAARQAPLYRYWTMETQEIFVGQCKLLYEKDLKLSKLKIELQGYKNVVDQTNQEDTLLTRKGKKSSKLEKEWKI